MSCQSNSPLAPSHVLLEFLSVFLHFKRLKLQPKLIVLLLCQDLVAFENLPPGGWKAGVVQVLLKLTHVAVMLLELLLLKRYPPCYGPACAGLEDLTYHDVQE